MVKQDVYFANVDLEIECAVDLSSLIDALGPDILIQYHDRLENGNDFSSLALGSVESGMYGEPEKTISAFCDLIEKLPDEPRNTWRISERREFDIGLKVETRARRFLRDYQRRRLLVLPNSVRRLR